jgi:hypothetical protein
MSRAFIAPFYSQDGKRGRENDEIGRQILVVTFCWNDLRIRFVCGVEFFDEISDQM